MANMKYGFIRNLSKGEAGVINPLPETAKLPILLKRHTEATGHKFEGAEVTIAGKRVGVVLRVG